MRADASLAEVREAMDVAGVTVALVAQPLDGGVGDEALPSLPAHCWVGLVFAADAHAERVGRLPSRAALLLSGWGSVGQSGASTPAQSPRSASAIASRAVSRSASVNPVTMAALAAAAAAIHRARAEAQQPRTPSPVRQPQAAAPLAFALGAASASVSPAAASAPPAQPASAAAAAVRSPSASVAPSFRRGRSGSPSLSGAELL